MRVKINSCIGDSEFKSDLGVLQGSSLSSTLFAVYVNDILVCINDKKDADPAIIKILTSITSNFQMVCYADDAALLVAHPDVDQLQIDTQLIADLIFRYYVANRISIHPGKTDYIHINPELKYIPMVLNFGSAMYAGSTHAITATKDNVRYLGFFINYELNTDHFFSIYINKMNKGLFYLRKNNYSLCPELKTLIYFSYIHSHLEFISLYLCMTNRHIRHKISIIQKKAIRIVCGLKSNYHTADFFDLLDILPIAELHIYNVVKFVEFIKQSELDAAFRSYWPFNFETGLRHSLRYQKSIVVDRVLKDKFKKLPIFAFAGTYNDISRIFLTIDLPELKTYLLAKHKIANKCNKSSKKCFACLKHAGDSKIVWQKRVDKISRLKDLIKQKGIDRTARYNWLSSKIAR